MSYITNRSIKRDYEILETIRAGIQLLGTEVKSVRTGKGSLVGAKILIRGGEAFLVGANIPPHQEKNTAAHYDPERTRRLLLKKREIIQLINKTESKKLTLVPISLYNTNRRLKVDVGIGRKKQSRDRREELRKRDAERAIRREIKN